MTSVRTLPLMTRLNQEWAATYVDRADDFGPLGTLPAGELLARIRTLVCQRSYDELDGILYELLTQIRNGSKPAERLLVQMLIPVAQRMAHRVRNLGDLDRNDRISFAIGCAWEEIRHHAHERMHLHQKLYGNLTHNLLRRLTRESASGDDRVVTCSDDILEDVAGAAPAEQVPAEVRLAKLFDWAIDAGIVTSDDVALLSRVALREERTTLADIAAELDTTAEALRKSTARIRQRISRAILESA